MFLPKKGSQKWFYVFIAVWFINVTAIVVSRYQVGVSFDYPTTLVFVSLALLVSSITALGWFGLHSFTRIFMLFNIIAILNMLTITGVHSTDVFSGITSLLNFIFFISIGTLAGLIIEVIRVYLLKQEEETKKLMKKNIDTKKKAPAKKKTTVAKKKAPVKKKTTTKKK